MTEDLIWAEYQTESIAPERTITISFDISSCDVELALATNGATLRQASLLASGSVGVDKSGHPDQTGSVA